MKPGFNDSAPRKRHHAVGLISFGTAVVTGFISLLLFIVSMIPESGTYTAQRFTNILIIYGLAVAPVLHATGLILGIVGLFLKESKKIFPVLGIILNALPLIFAAILWILLFWVIWAVISSGGGWM
jgi:hypothetical protein